VDEEVRRLERRALLGDEAAIARLARARKLSGIETLERAMDPSWKARERREEAERESDQKEIEFCRRAVNDGITANLYRGRRCWCQVFMSLRRLESLPEFTPLRESWHDWAVFDAERRGRDYE